jgi:hypothetical protein
MKPLSCIAAFRVALAVLILGLLGACSSIRPYANSMPENMRVEADVRSGSAQLHVYDMDSACNVTYQGTVDLSGRKAGVGLPVNRPSYLVFEFYDKSIFTGSRSTSYELYLAPRAGARYLATASYVDNMYDAAIYELDGHGGRHPAARIDSPCAARKKSSAGQ